MMNIHKLLGSLLASLLWLGSAASPAQANPPQTSEVLFKGGYAEVIYDPEYIPTLGLKVGIKTLILLPSDERIVRVEPGVRGTAIEIKYGANWVAIRPNIDRLSTNLHIPTDQGRVYSFNLIEGGGPHKEPHQKVVVVRPDMELDGETGAPAPAPTPVPAPPAARQPQPAPDPQQAMPAVVGMDDDGAAPQMHVVRPVPGTEVLRKLDDDYKISNQKPKVFNISRVYNDGSRTFVVFKTAMNEAPLFYRISPEGKREIMTYRVDPGKDPRDPDVFIIPRLVDRGTVKVGDYESTFIWRKAE